MREVGPLNAGFDLAAKEGQLCAEFSRVYLTGQAFSVLATLIPGTSLASALLFLCYYGVRRRVRR